jgi:type IV pilus assembly protein PilB
MQQGDIVKASNQLGRSLLKEGLLTENQLRYALELQLESLNKKRLGDILVELGYVTKRQIREISRKFNYRLQVGSILVDSGTLTEELLQEALAEQRVSRKRLGEILVERNVISEEQMAQALSQHLDYPYIVPSKRMVDRELLQLLPEKSLRHHVVLPLFRSEGVVTVLVHDPFDTALLQMLTGAFGNDYELAVGPRKLIRRVLQEMLDERTLQAEATTTSPDTEGSFAFVRYDLDPKARVEAGSGHIANVVDHIIANGIAERASDIHIDCMYNKIRVRYRIDGILFLKTELPKSIAEPLTRRMKVLSGVNVVDLAEAQEGHISVKSADKSIDLRVSFYPTVLGPSITIRVLTKDVGLKDLSDLGMLPRVLTTLKDFYLSPSGLTLFCGPTGVGKTTSLYASLNHLNQCGLKICTMESPVEYSIEGIAQHQMIAFTGKWMEDIFRAMLHQDPDVIVLGEITSDAIAAAAVQLAVSGHMVFSTIHTDDAISAILQLMDSGLKAYLRSSTGLVVISQRLVRNICPQCKEAHMPPREILREFHLRDLDPDDCVFHHGAGCPKCNHTGFYDRSGVFEFLAMNDEIRDAFLETGKASTIRSAAASTRHYLSLREAGFIKALQGFTTLDEAHGILSYSEKQASASTQLSKESVEYWMGTGEEAQVRR